MAQKDGVQNSISTLAVQWGAILKSLSANLFSAGLAKTLHVLIIIAKFILVILARDTIYYFFAKYQCY